MTKLYISYLWSYLQKGKYWMEWCNDEVKTQQEQIN